MPTFPGAPLSAKATAKQRAERDAAFKAWCAAEAERIRRQRLYLTVLRGTFRDGMVRALCDRAWALLEMGEAEAADALLEFAPEPEATALLDEFFNEEAA